MRRKLALGTVQIGLNYGINNISGRVSESELYKLLNIARRNNVELIDTAMLYGDSEERLGTVIKKENFKFQIISKLPDCNYYEVEKYFFNSLKKLKIERIYGYIFHHFSGFKNDRKNYDFLHNLKNKGLIEKIGFSLYYPSDLEYLIKQNLEFDLIQIPYSIFDQRFSKYFEILGNQNVDIFARSIYLQGLVFKKIEELYDKFIILKDKIKTLNTLAVENKTTISNLCYNFVNHNIHVKNIIVGFDNSSQLAGLLKNEKTMMDESLYENLLSMKEDNEQIILPTNW